MKTKRQLSRAVQEARAPKEVEADTPERRRWRELDYYASPPWSARAGAELVKRIDPLADTVWEPACGDGIMAQCLKEYFPNVHASDIWPQGYGAQLDFLLEANPPDCDWVITNPPYTLAMDFLRRGLEVARSGVALLCRMAILETEGRYEQIYRGPHPLTVFAPFSERVPMKLGPWDPEFTSSATAYAWLLFVKEPSSVMKWAARVHPIPPGTRGRLSKSDDARRFGRAADMPLFSEGNDGEAATLDRGTP